MPQIFGLMFTAPRSETNRDQKKDRRYFWIEQKEGEVMAWTLEGARKHFKNMMFPRLNRASYLDHLVLKFLPGGDWLLLFRAPEAAENYVALPPDRPF